MVHKARRNLQARMRDPMIDAEDLRLIITDVQNNAPKLCASGAGIHVVHAAFKVCRDRDLHAEGKALLNAVYDHVSDVLPRYVVSRRLLFIFCAVVTPTALFPNHAK